MYGLRFFRRCRGLTQADLADVAGLSRETVCRIERGAQEPSVETLCTLAEALGVAIHELLAGPGAVASALRRAAAQYEALHQKGTETLPAEGPSSHEEHIPVTLLEDLFGDGARTAEGRRQRTASHTGVTSVSRSERR